jgi:hypothetical protein
MPFRPWQGGEAAVDHYSRITDCLNLTTMLKEPMSW